jgi:hypothetical protein
MRNRLLLYITRKLRARVIETGGHPYMLRYYLGQWRGITFYLHQYLREDAERHLHNHPFDHSGSIVLCGRYVEERLERICPFAGPIVVLRTIRLMNLIGPSAFHRITKPKLNTWTLFWLKRSPSYGWGFLEHTPPARPGEAASIRYVAAEDGASGGDRWWLKPSVKRGSKLRAELDVAYT